MDQECPPARGVPTGQEDSELGSTHNGQDRGRGQSPRSPGEVSDPVAGRASPERARLRPTTAQRRALGVPQVRVHIGSALHTLGLGQVPPTSEPPCSYLQTRGLALPVPTFRTLRIWG